MADSRYAIMTPRRRWLRYCFALALTISVPLYLEFQNNGSSLALAQQFMGDPWCTVQDVTDGTWIPKSESYRSLAEMRIAENLMPYTLPQHLSDAAWLRADGVECFTPDSQDKEITLDGKRVLNVSAYKWQPARKCKIQKWDRTAFIRRLLASPGGLILIGDSIVAQHFDGAALLIGNEGPIYEKVAVGGWRSGSQRELYLDTHHPDAAALLQGLPQRHSQNISIVTFLRSDVAVSMEQMLEMAGMHYPTIPYKVGAYDTLTASIDVLSETLAERAAGIVPSGFTLKPTIVVQNVGPHINVLTYNDENDATLANMRAMVSGIATQTLRNVTALQKKHSFEYYFRATSPGHKNCNKYSGPQLPPIDTSSPIPNWGWSAFQLQNEIWKKALTATSGRYFDTWNLMISRPDAHRHPATDGDCLHHCMPGPVLEWTRLLWHMISH